MRASATLRHIYSASQIERYFNHIRLPANFRPGADGVGHSLGLEFLQRLQRYQLSCVPWENLSKHYNPIPGPVIPLLGSNELFEKIVGRGAAGRIDGGGGRGGGCYEINTLFGNVLRSLGYDVYSGAARVHMGQDARIAWGHMLNFVTIDNQKYVVDAGFGGPGPIEPLPLQDGVEHSTVAPASARYIKAPIKSMTNQSQEWWIYQHRSNSSPENEASANTGPLPPSHDNPPIQTPLQAQTPSSVVSNLSSHSSPSTDEAKAEKKAQWLDVYSFSELEFTPEDYKSLSIASSYRRDSFFTFTLAASRMVLAREVPYILGSLAATGTEDSSWGNMRHGEKADSIVGSITLTTNECKCSVRGVARTLQTFKTEQDRLDALRMYFGIDFSSATGEVSGVAGSAIGFDRVQF
ncbi:cysteine proteinase [Clavulina sp. PMI_390]|nr:cysteine proteinase [Clavulina sp. PMI_390]